MKRVYSLSIAIVFINVFIQASGQSDDVLLKAMQDEITRNLNELKLPDYEKPFFLMYGVVDQKTYSISASMGSLSRSSVSPERFKSTTRVLVGDYSFNDESLEDNQSRSTGVPQIPIPEDDDYSGIRRSFWASTDQVYRDAARVFERNKESLKETGKPLEEVPHRSFAKIKPVTIIGSMTPFDFKKEEWEAKARKLSELFLNHPSIANSGVIINYIEGYRYLVNTEGAKVKTPFSVAVFRAIGFGKGKDGEQTLKGISFVAKTPDKLPDDQRLTSEINLMIEQLEGQSKLPKFSEEYSGPVLVMGQAVAEVFSSSQFGGNESIMASDNIPKLTGYQYDTEFSLETKIGKPVVSELISVTAKPKLKSYNGVDLLGSYDVDSEGVVPDDQVKVIEHGVLKTLLNNRTLTKSNQVANGFASGVGVIEVTVDSKETGKSLKKKLIQSAKKQKLEYAIIVRSSGSSGLRLLDVYRVSVADGKEELFRGAALGRITNKNMKHILGASEKYQAYNIGNLNNVSTASGSGIVSLIVPEAILFDDTEVTKMHLPSVKEEDYVSNPLVHNK